MKKTILITGISGFLGWHLAQVCLASGYEVVGTGRSAVESKSRYKDYIQAPIEETDWENILRQHTPVACFHLAASASVTESLHDPFGDFSTVLPGTARLLHSIARVSPGTKFILFSSAAVYGNPAQLPISECARTKPISPYGVHKHIAEQLVLSIGECYGLTTACLRIFSAFGERLKKQIFFDLHMKAKLAIANKEKFITLYGTGNETRDFIHGIDVARAALLISETIEHNESLVINIASGVETSIRCVAELYLEAANISIDVIYNGAVKAGDPTNWCADISWLEKNKFERKVSLKEGLRSYAAWISNI